MSNLVSVPKNGSTRQTMPGFPEWTRWFDDFFGIDTPSMFASNFNRGITLPKVNIRETDDAYFVDMAVPGMKKSDFQIDLDNQVLSITAELQDEQDYEGDGQFTRREFGYSSFKRSFSLPETVEDQKIKANYHDGILNIHLPKKEEARRKPARTIKIS